MASAKAKGIQKIALREGHGRPAEGIIIYIKANKDLHLSQQPTVQVEGRQVGTSKFGNHGGSGALRAPHGSGAFGAPHGGGRVDDSDVDDWFCRRQAKLVKQRIAKHARKRTAGAANSPPNKNAPLTAPVPDSPGGWSKDGF